MTNAVASARVPKRFLASSGPILVLALLQAGAFCAPAGAEPASPASAPRVRFAVLGDRVGSHVPGIYEQIVREVARLRPDFVLTVGDQIEGYVDDSLQIAAAYQEYDSLVAPLTMPLYRTPGNHDIWSALAERFYRREVGSPYRSFDQGNLHFVIADVSRWDTAALIPAEQLRWLAEDLQQHAGAAYTFVFMHKPLWFNGVSGGQPDTLHALFKRYGVDAVFTGHFHVYFSERIDGILYTSLGSSGGAMDPGPSGLGFHFGWVTVDDQGIHVAPIKLGAVLPWDECTATDQHTIASLARRGMRIAAPVAVRPDLTVADCELMLTVDNARSPVEIADTLRWSIPAGWSVAPAVMPVAVKPGSTAETRFRVACTGPLYPVPVATLDFPYRPDRRTPIPCNLKVERRVQVPRADGPPVIDGRLTDACWRNPVTRLYSPDGSDPRTDPTEFYFAYDGDYLYLGALCREREMAALVASTTDRDGGVFVEDCVGYFFSPGMDSDVVYQVYFNPLGTVFDQRITANAYDERVGDRDWNCTCQVATQRDADAWSVEVAISAASFAEQLERGAQWRLNFRRKQKRLETGADWQVPIDYDPQTYGVLVLS